MEEFRHWCLCLIVAAAAGTLATVIMPKGSMDKTVRAVIGIFVVSVICAPLAQIKSADVSVQAFADYDSEYQNTEELEEYMISACRTAIENTVLKEAEHLGVQPVSIEAEISVDDDKCIIIHKIRISIPGSSEKINADLSEKLEEKLGVPVETE